MMQKFVFLVFVAFACAATTWNELHDYTFEQYVQEFQKDYSTEEFQIRKSLFEIRLQKIKKHNQDTTKTWKEGVNHLTDRKHEEFSALLGLKKKMLYASKAARPETPYIPKAPATNLPTSIDWRTQGIITAVKDQGDCGSCWTFGTAETLESYWALATGQLTDLSEQQILDCTPNPKHCGGTGGCGGGTAELAYAQIIAMGGLSSEWTYPYTSYTGNNDSCQSVTPAARISNYTTLPSNQLKPLLIQVGTTGPLAISVDASAWSDYESGVFNGCNQTNPDIDHEVQLVGYGTDSQQGDYWLVRNSWSPVWGEAGYIRLARQASPQCGIDLNPSDGTGCSGGPPRVVVCGTCGILYDSVFPTVQTR